MGASRKERDEMYKEVIRSIEDKDQIPKSVRKVKSLNSIRI